MTSFPAVINLSSLDGSNGFRINGEVGGDAGFSVSSAGDVNGDGFADVIVGAPWGTGPSGAAYVVFGTSAGRGSSLDLSSLNGSNGFQINSETPGSLAGWSVSSAGDVNGDGLSDVTISAMETGVAYVVFGKMSGFAPELALSTLNGTNGFRLIGGGNPSLITDMTVSSAGDVNGDGFADLLVGCSSYSGPASYLVFGKKAGFGANLDLGSLDGSNGVRFNPAAFYYGGHVSAAGDVNGDGFDDFIINDPWSGPNKAGVSYVVFGRSSGFPAVFDFASLNGANGFRINGEAKDDAFGAESASAGDINGDGFDDVIIGARGADPNGNWSGSSYVVFGKASGFAASFDVSSLNGTNGFRIDGEAAGDGSGRVSGAGDVNGDGFADLIIGAQGADPNGSESGASYVVFGKAAGFAPILKLSSLDGSNGFRINGEAVNDNSGVVSAAGDLNGDGVGDLLIGAPNAADPHGGRFGAAYVVFGHATGTTPIETNGITTLALSGNHFHLLQNGGGPSLKFSGQDVAGGQFGDWTPIGAEKTASGYHIAWKSLGSNLYSLWNTDANGNYVANIVGAVSGSDPAILSAESFFQQDLNGDGQIASAMVSIEANGTTALASAANHFYLLQNGSGPSLKMSGQDITGGQFGDWTPIGAEKTASGYEIAWKSLGSNLYSLWNTDANGNYLANIVGGVSGSDPTLFSTESFFQQDLNGDGQVGSPLAPVETNGATTLASSANHFYLLQNGSGPSLKFSGQDIVGGQFGDWTPIAAEKTGSGYEIAWKSLGSNLYSLWNTDANGNYLANIGGAVSGSDPSLLSAESFFQQDLNGDGLIS